MILSMTLSGCGGSLPFVGGEPDPDLTLPVVEPELPQNAPPTSSMAVPNIGLSPLPTVEQVQEAAPGGRRDPFEPLPIPAAEQLDQGQDALGNGEEPAELGLDPAADLLLTGVMQVGGQDRALVVLPTTSGVLCVSADGRCSPDSKAVLPLGWSVLAIDVQRGCISLAQDGKPQPPVCMA